MRNLTNSGIEVVVNNLSGGNAIDITNQNINVDINKAPITTTTASTDQYLLQDGNNNIKKILYSDLIGSSGSGLTAGEALSITGSQIDLSISKQNSITTSADTDLYVLEDSSGNIRKITRANLLAGFINTNWTLNSGVLYPLATATNVAIGTTTMNGSEKLRVNGNTEFDGKLTINGSNVLEATALSGSYNFNIQNTNFTNSGTLNLMGVNSVGATNLLTITNDSTLPKMNFPSGIWTNGNATNITETELFYLDGVSSNIQTQLNSLSSSVSTNSTNIGTNSSNITALQTQQSTNTSNISTNTSNISSLQSQQNTNTSNISTNTGNISSLQSQQNTNTAQISTNQSNISTNTGNITTNTTGISDIKTKYDFTGSVANGKLLIGNSSNYSVGELLSSDNSVTITKSAGGIDLVVPSSSSLSAGTGINITNNFINYDINKETAYTSPNSGDLMLLYDSVGNATKKITFQNFNAGLQTQITNNDNDITSLNSSVSTNTTGITNIKNKYDFSTTVLDGKLLIGSTSTGNYSSALLTSTGGTLTITNGSNSINLESNHTSLSAGVGIALNANAIDLDINKPNSFSSPVSADLLVMYDTTNSLTKKITFSDFNAGLQAQITSNDNDISALTTQQNTNTSNISTNTNNIALNTAAISNLVSTANSSNFGTTASSAITVGNSSQSLALNSASMNCISAGKNFFRSNIASGVGFQIQAYNGSSYSSAIEVHNVSSGFPYLNLLLSNGFTINQYTGQSRNLIVDTNGKLNISNDMPITYTGGDGINISGSNAIQVDISKQVAITTPANDDVFLVERNTGVINKIAYSDLGIGVVAGNAIAVSSGTTVNVEISKENTITSPASGDLLLLEQASDGVLKNITYSNLVSGVDVTTATSIGTAASGAITVGNANNQIMNLVGSTININGSNTITNRSSVSSGVSFKVDGYNSNDVAYYQSLKLDNSNVAGVRPTIDILGSSGFYGGAGQNLTIDANGKIDWITPSTTGTVLEQYNTTTDLLNSVQTSGKMALVKNPLKLWVYANLSTGLVWRSLSFDTATNLSLNTSTYQLNSGGSTSFNSGDVITASTTGDVVKITVKVNDDLNPTVVNSLTNSVQTALDGWDGSSVVSMANAFSLTDNQDGTYTYEGQVKTKNETDTTAISYTITDINSSTILTFNYSIQNSNPTGFGTGSPALGGYYAVYSVGAGAYFVQTSTNYNVGFVGGSQVYWYCNAGSFTTTTTPTNTSNNNPMIFHYIQQTYNSQNIAVFYATSYNGSAGSYTSYSNRHFAVGHNTANLAFVSAGNDEYYMYSGTYQMSYTSSYNKIGFASGQNTTYTNNNAKWKFYKVA